MTDVPPWIAIPVLIVCAVLGKLLRRAIRRGTGL